MGKLEEAKIILQDIGMPTQQQTDICAYTLLTLAWILPDSDWQDATNNWIRIHDIRRFAADIYGREYAENTRETIRKNCLHQLRDAAIVEDNGMATNSPNYRYRLTGEALGVISAFGTLEYEPKMEAFHHHYERLVDKYSSKKLQEKMPVLIDGEEFSFSPGKHNMLQKAILEEFAPRFAPGCMCLYVGDTTNKDMVKNQERLAALGFEITLHDKMPDVVLYREDKKWLYFVEAVTSVGPMSPKRVLELKEMTRGVFAGIIFVTAFLDFTTYKKFSNDLAWDTEVWIAEQPDHMIHMNGDRFIGPR